MPDPSPNIAELLREQRRERRRREAQRRSDSKRVAITRIDLRRKMQSIWGAVCDAIEELRDADVEIAGRKLAKPRKADSKYVTRFGKKQLYVEASVDSDQQVRIRTSLMHEFAAGRFDPSYAIETYEASEASEAVGQIVSLVTRYEDDRGNADFDDDEIRDLNGRGIYFEEDSDGET